MGTPEEVMAADLTNEIALFTPRLRAFAITLGADDAEAEDLAQETCLRAIGARDRFVPGTNLRAWLFTILRNLQRNRRRDSAIRPQLVMLKGSETDVTEFAATPPTDVEREALARAEVDEVLRAFRGLPPAFAIPLHLVAVEDLSYAQVAQILEIPVGTVMSRIYRARRLLLRRLGERPS
jgi:RNA polymerase sigma-70 factor (ECF subfamily)